MPVKESGLGRSGTEGSPSVPDGTGKARAMPGVSARDTESLRAFGVGVNYGLSRRVRRLAQN